MKVIPIKIHVIISFDVTSIVIYPLSPDAKLHPAFSFFPRKLLEYTL